MRIAYLGQMADVASENGISKKLRAQATHWLEAGHEVRYFSLVPAPDVWTGFAPVPAELVVRGGLGRRALRALELARRIRAWRPDIIYFRYGYHSAGLPRLFRDIPTVAEINSDDRTEYPLTLSRLKVAYHRLTRARILRPLAGFVTVTHELAERFAEWNRPTLVIANGIALDAFRQAPVASATSPRLIFLGNPGSPWHGLERVAELARLLPECGFDIVGLDEAAWRTQAGTPERPANVRLHGMLGRAAYEPLVAQATAALGSLALYKNDMAEACPLKVREYLALGLPVIAAYRDTDIPDGADYFLRLPNDATPLASHRPAIAAWIEAWRGRRVERALVAHLDTRVKEQQRLAFLARMARPSP